MKNKAKGNISIFLCAFIWSTSGLFIKLLTWHPLLITGGRSLFAIIVLFIYRAIIIIQNRQNKPIITKNVIIAGITYAMTMLLFVYANKLTTSANAIMLEYSAPIWAGLFGWIITREKLRKESIIAMAIMIFGLFVFFRNSLSMGKYLGDLFALLAGLSFGAHAVFMAIQKKENPIDALLISHFICLCFSIPMAIKNPPLLNITTIGIILFMGIIQMGISSFFFSYGIKIITGMSAMMISAIEPVLNPIWVFVFMGEKPSISAIIGGTIIVFAILFSIGWRHHTLKQFYKEIYKYKIRR